MDVAIPTKRFLTTATGFTQEGEEYTYDSGENWCVSTTIELPVRGVLQDDIYDSTSGYIYMYMSSNKMVQYINENIAAETLSEDEFYEILHFLGGYPRSIIRNLSNWAPWAYYLMVDDVSKIDTVKRKY